MSVSSHEGGVFTTLCDTLDSLEIPPGSSAQFIDTVHSNNHTRLHVSRSKVPPRFHVAYRTHVTAPDHPSGRHFYVSWRGFLFFDNNQIVTYTTITDGDFPELVIRQPFRLRQAVKRGRTLPLGFEHVTTTEFERLKLCLATWSRLPRLNKAH